MTCCTPNKVYLPTNIKAGLSFRAVIELAEYPTSVWSMSLHLRGPAVIDLTAVVDGATFVFSADAATTADWAPGRYWFTLRAEGGGQVQEAGTGEIEVIPDLTAQTAGYDGRTPNEIGYAAITAVLQKRATQDQQKYVINNRELWRTPMADLLKLAAFYKAAVNRERNKARGRSTFGKAIHVRFSNQ
jgi:hypothetical protein